MRIITAVFLLLGILMAPLVSVASPALAKPVAETQNSPFDSRPISFAVVDEVSIAYQDMGPQDGEPILLVMGLGAQMLHWGDAFVQGLIDEGYRVIAFDNRDAGLSQKFYEGSEPSMIWTMLQYKFGWEINSDYSIADMANDAVGLLDHLQVEKAHIVGASMGGMIAQHAVLAHPERFYSLVSMMSTTGAPDLPEAEQDALQALFGAGLPENTREEVVYRGVHAVKVIGSKKYFDEAQARSLVERQINRGRYKAGKLRQMQAVFADGDRTERLKAVKVPTLVLHGAEDPLVPPAHGKATADAIPGAEYMEIADMGHNLEPEVARSLIAGMVPFLQQASPAGAGVVDAGEPMDTEEMQEVVEQ
ncbi:alpha/beta fold hydrolase [Biformimicrobium ophioploci]|nr:alpha/beta fold hydrolase [Microbulbifer sp. NKW57]